ncbi:MAG: histidine phosphatase family protein [Limosilactobacillus gorillae]|nr:histidine phosphatase family protein [Limosilactobacillus gorillae]
MAINVYFVRHGQTYFNLYHRMQGWSDSPLTEKGLADAARAGKALAKINFDYAFSSDLKRTVETAHELLANHPGTLKDATPDAAWREEFFGYFEGLNSDASSFTISRQYRTFEEMIANYGVETTRNKIAATDPFKQAEDNETFWKRLEPGFQTLRKLPDGSNVLVVSHGMTIRSIGSRFGKGAEFTAQPQNGALTKLVLDQDGAHFAFYNQLQVPE